MFICAHGGETREVDGEDTPVLGTIAHGEAAAVDLGAPAAHREAQPKPRPVGAALLERVEQVFDVTLGKPATLVFDLDKDAVGRGAAAQRHPGARLRELERVLQQVRHHRREHRAIGVDACGSVSRNRGERETARSSLQRRRRRQLREELGDAELCPLQNLVPQSHLRDRSLDQITEGGECPPKYLPRASAYPQIPVLRTSNATDAVPHEITDLVSEEADAFVSSGGLRVDEGLVVTAVLRHGARNRIVQTTAQRAEILDADRRVGVQGELGDRLAHLTIAVHDLRYGASLQEETPAVPRGAHTNLRMRRSPGTQDVDEVIEEFGQPRLDFAGNEVRNGPGRQLYLAAVNDFLPMLRDECMKHD